MEETTAVSAAWMTGLLPSVMTLAGAVIGGLIAWVAAHSSAKISARTLREISRDTAIREHEARRREIGEKLHITLERLLSDLSNYKSMVEARRNGRIDDEKFAKFLESPSADDEFGWSLIPLYVATYFPTAVPHLDSFEKARLALHLSLRRLELGKTPGNPVKESFDRTKKMQAVETTAQNIQREVIVQLREAVVKLQS